MKKPLRAARSGQLREVQKAMANAIMRPLATRDRMQKSSVIVAEAIIKPNDRLTSFERLEIYNRQYWFRILDCLYDDYPGLRAVLGDKKFEKLARAYLAKYPSESFSLRNLGSHVEKFLRAEPKWTAPHQRLALDMVRIEWANIVAFDEMAKPPVHVDDLLGRNPAKVKLALQPYITLLDVRYPVDDLLIAAKKGDDRLRSEASNAVALQHKRSKRISFRGLKPRPLYIAVHRMNLAVYYKPLTHEQFAILQLLQQGHSIEKACAFLAKRRAPAGKNWASELQYWFKEWTSFGWFCER